MPLFFWILKLGGGNSNIFYVHPESLAKIFHPFWQAYFSKGLVQPPTSEMIDVLVEDLIGQFVMESQDGTLKDGGVLAEKLASRRIHRIFPRWWK